VVVVVVVVAEEEVVVVVVVVVWYTELCAPYHTPLIHGQSVMGSDTALSLPSCTSRAHTISQTHSAFYLHWYLYYAQVSPTGQSRILFAGSRVEGTTPFTPLALVAPCPVTSYADVVAFVHKVTAALGSCRSCCGRLTVTAVLTGTSGAGGLDSDPPVLRFRRCVIGGAVDTAVVDIVPVVTGLVFDQDAGCCKRSNGDACGVVVCSALAHSAMAVMESSVLQSLIDLNDVGFDAARLQGTALLPLSPSECGTFAALSVGGSLHAAVALMRGALDVILSEVSLGVDGANENISSLADALLPLMSHSPIGGHGGITDAASL
jgi:hypothetical protein